MSGKWGEDRQPPQEAIPTPTTSAPHKLQRLDHVALPVPDLVEAERWYVEVLGAEVIERHGWGGDTKRTRPHVDLRLATGGVFSLFLGAAGPSPSSTTHYAFASGSLEEFDDWKSHLSSVGVETDGPIVHPGFSGLSHYFHDPYGHRLEIFAVVEDEETAVQEAERRGGGLFRPKQRSGAA